MAIYGARSRANKNLLILQTNIHVTQLYATIYSGTSE